MAVTRATLGPVGSPVAPVTAEELTDFARITPNEATGEPDPWLDAAIGRVQGACGPILATDMRVPAQHDGRRGSLILPTCAISAVTELKTPTGVDVVGRLTAADVDFEAAIVRLPQLDAGEWVVRVTTVTSTERTAALKDAVLIIAAHLWGARANGASRTVPGQAAAGAGYAIPNRASELMAPYLIASVA